jgi:hypothetical protein
MTDRLSRRYSPRFEVLENRLTPDGNVSAVLRGGSLFLTGDAQANEIMITQPSLGTFIVRPIDDATTINGKARAQTFRNVTANVSINLNNGADLVQLGAAKGDSLVINRNLQILGVNGDKTVQALADLFVGGSIEIRTNGGNDNFEFTGANYVHGNMTLNAGRGDNVVTIAPTGGVNTVAGALSVLNARGNSSTSVFDTSVLGNLNLNNSGALGANGSSDIFFGVSSGDVKAAVLGDANVTLADGGGSLTLTDTNIAGTARITAAPTANPDSPPVSIVVGPLVNGSDVGIAGSLFVTAGAPAFVSLGTVEGGAAAMLRVAGNTLLRTGDGDDVISLAGLVSQLDMRINTFGGADLVSMDDSIIFGALQVGLGNGDDTFLIEGKENAGKTEFVSNVSVNLGNDDDSILVGVLGDPTRQVITYASRLFDGGAGFNRILFPFVNMSSPDGSSSDDAFVNFQ